MDEFCGRLSESARRFGIRRLAGALLKDGAIHFADCAPVFGPDAAQSVSCLGKIFTATLIAHAIQAGHLTLDQTVHTIFETGPLTEIDGAARNVTVAHLLSHTHGWESTPDPATRWTSDGFIAAEAILRDLPRRPRLYEPGEMYSYDVAGYLLLGAILERIYKEKFGALLHQRLFEPLGIESADRAEQVCPADGHGISLSVRALARFAEYNLAPAMFQHVLPNGAEAVQMLLPRVVDAPGWSPFYQGTTLAWRDLGAGWLSHEGVGMHGSYSMVRINPTIGMGLILVSPDPRSRLLGAQLFSDLARADLTSDFALPLGGAALTDFDPAPICGTYVNGKSRTTICRSGEGQIQALVYGRAFAQSALQPATRDVLFLKSPMGRRYFLQPLSAGNSAQFTHIWDGYEVARRIS